MRPSANCICGTSSRTIRSRGERLAIEAVGLFFDYSKNRISDETLDLLFRLARESRLQEKIDAMFRGEKINITEKRAVLHTALRAPRGASVVLDGENVVPGVHVGARSNEQFRRIVA